MPDPACSIVLVIPPGIDVTVYEVTAEPPLDAGALNSTDAEVAPVAATVPMLGAPGSLRPQTFGFPDNPASSSFAWVKVFEQYLKLFKSSMPPIA